METPRKTSLGRKRSGAMPNELKKVSQGRVDFSTGLGRSPRLGVLERRAAGSRRREENELLTKFRVCDDGYRGNRQHPLGGKLTGRAVIVVQRRSGGLRRSMTVGMFAMVMVGMAVVMRIVPGVSMPSMIVGSVPRGDNRHRADERGAIRPGSRRPGRPRATG